MHKVTSYYRWQQVCFYRFQAIEFLSKRESKWLSLSASKLKYFSRDEYVLGAVSGLREEESKYRKMI